MNKLNDNSSNLYNSTIDSIDRDNIYTISQLAKEFGITTRTIRYYEDEGLIKPGRNGRNRIYSVRDHTRLKLILRGKRLGFSINEIREMFAFYDSATGEVGQLKHILNKVKERKLLLNQKLEDIHHTMDELKEFESHCICRLEEMQNANKKTGTKKQKSG
ncbi:MAG: MerR family DNA-binding transcriptional regulator [Proteobacteria bacterium]|nr:MerR family DNA-binding transcriptional regulator [Pseudomonadota bacterium]